MSSNLRRDFESQDELISYLGEVFSDSLEIDANVSATMGGRETGESRLDNIKPEAYAQSRNYIDGDVTYLSPYIRHGIFSLSEVRNRIFELIDNADDGEKLIAELGFRDYFQRVYDTIGDAIWESIEPWKTGFVESDYATEMPNDVLEGQTGLLCIDSWQQELIETGYLHNHVRMYLAAYLIHWRHIHWRAGAEWFLQHLLDGDPASNNLSWQWVASTFSHKPYYFNRENLERFTNGVYCKNCPLHGQCDFEGNYSEIAKELFPNIEMANQQKRNPKKSLKKRRGRLHD